MTEEIADPAMTDSPSELTSPTEKSTLPFTFTGNAKDYFRIWIVNLLLTLLTVGLWSPWAKVRKRRYLYGHTWLASCNFEYHGNPVAILRGRLVAAAAIGIYWLFENLIPITRTWLLLALACGAPWIIARSLAFNAANSSYRAIRFEFDGRTRELAMATWPLAASIAALIALSGNPMDVLTRPQQYFGRIGLAYIALLVSFPYVTGRVRQLLAGRSAWGNQRFETTMRIRSVYGIYLVALALCLGLLIVASVVGSAGVFLGKALAAVGIAIMFAVMLVAAAGMFITWTAYINSRMTNLLFNSTKLSDIAQLRCSMSARSLAKLYAVNLLAIVGTCGLLIPWAVVRLTRYRVEATSVEIESPLAKVAATVTQNPSATGEELGELFGIDLAL
jgi:uncharacterized membrane protein YjgN (DUF898 family)